MKTLLTAIALTIAAPAFAQATAPADAHADHANHAAHGAGQAGEHAGHDMKGGCCDEMADGKAMPCCEKMKAAGKEMACCDKPAADAHAGHDMRKANPHAGHDTSHQ